MRRVAGVAFFALCTAVVWGQDESQTPAPEESSAAAPTTTPYAETTAASSPSPASSPVGTPSVGSTPAKRSWFGKMLHPFGGGKEAAAPSYSNAKLRGLVVEVQVSPQPVQLSEVRSLEVKVTITNKGKRGINLDFANEQRIEITLMSSSEVVLTRWSETHAFKDKPGTLLINPQEHVEYNEKISTRELTPDKVFICEAYFPKYPELRARQKFLTAP